MDANASSANTPEQSAGRDTSSCQPIVDCSLHPIRNGDGPNVTPLSAQIHDGPVLFATLAMVERKVGQFSTTKPAAKQNCQNCSIPLAFWRPRVWDLPEGAGLFCG